MDIDEPISASSHAARHPVNGGGHGDIDAELDIFDETTNLEGRFFQEGYDDGFAHGRLHGLFEGRALGQEKAWEIWEEVGFYEGFAGMWGALLPAPTGGGGGEEVGRKSKEARSAQHVRQLLDLIASFPITNPTPSPAAPISERDMVISSNADSADTPAPPAGAGAGTEADTTDLPRLLSAIRAKYRLLCTSLGVRPRLVAAPAVEGVYDAASPGEGVDYEGVEGGGGGGTIVNTAAANGGGVGVVQGIEGPMKGVDTRQLRF